MNILTIKTVNDKEIELKLPSDLNELTFGQLISLNNHELSNVEILSVLSGVPVDDILEAKEIDKVFEDSKIYIDMLTYNVKIVDIDKIPANLIFKYDGKRKKIKIKKYIAITPVGGYFFARKIIFNEIKLHLEQFGEDSLLQNFRPSFKAMGEVVDAFLYCQVTGKLWTDQGRESIAEYVNAADVIAIAKYFFNAYPEINRYKPDGKMKVIAKAILGRFKELSKVRGVGINVNLKKAN